MQSDLHTLDTLSLEEVTERLKALTDNEPAPVRVDRNIYLTEEQWMAHLRLREQDGWGSIYLN